MLLTLYLMKMDTIQHYPTGEKSVKYLLNIDSNCKFVSKYQTVTRMLTNVVVFGRMTIIFYFLWLKINCTTTMENIKFIQKTTTSIIFMRIGSPLQVISPKVNMTKKGRTYYFDSEVWESICISPTPGYVKFFHFSHCFVNTFRYLSFISYY